MPRPAIERRLIRLAIVGAVVASALLAGSHWTPAVRSWYWQRELDSATAADRLEAANRLAGLARTDPALLDPLLPALLNLLRDEDPAVRLRAMVIARWTLDEVPAATDAWAGRLATLDDADFHLFVRQLRGTSLWSTDTIPLDQRLRYERDRLASPDAKERIAALRSLARAGPATLEQAREAVLSAVDDADADVAVAALEVVRGATADLRHEALARAVNGPPAARARAALLLGVESDATTPAWFLRMLNDEATEVRIAALWTAGRLGDGVSQGDLERRVTDDDLTVEERTMAAWATAGPGMLRREAEESPPDVLPRDPDTQAFPPPVLLRMLHADRARQRSHFSPRVLLSLVQESDPDVAHAAALLLAVPTLSSSPSSPTPSDRGDETATTDDARTPEIRSADARDELRAAILDRLGSALADGDARDVALFVHALGAAADRAVAPLLADLAAREDLAPMIRLTATEALAVTDSAGSTDLMLDLLAVESAVVRDLTAFKLGQLDDPPVDLLQASLDAELPLVRGGASLALAKAARRGRLPEPGQLDRLLARRLDPEDESWEPREEIRAYYLCARLLLGEATVRPDLDLYLLNENFSRVAIFGTLIQAGDEEVLDLLLLRSPGPLDAASLLWDARLNEIIGDRLPNAPRCTWYENGDWRARQFARLQDWWHIHRAR
jgi:hypothetical protein